LERLKSKTEFTFLKRSAPILKYLFFVLLCYYPFLQQSFAQTKQIDSLKNIISRSADDSLKVDNINQLTKLYFSIDAKSALRQAEWAEKISLKINYKNGLALAYKNMGIVYYNQSIDSIAYQKWRMALSLYEITGDKVGQANIYSNLGVIFLNQTEDNKAVECFLKASKIAEELNDSLRLATVLMNIGSVYLHKKATYNNAIDYLQKSLPICKALGDRDALGTVLANLGEVYYEKEMLDTALFYLQKSLIYYKGSENITYSYIYIGKVYTKKGDYENAILNENLALGIAQKFDNKLDITKALLALGNTYKQKGEQKKAIDYYQKGIAIASEIKANNELKDLYHGISSSYSLLFDFNEAYKFQNLLINIKDTIYNQENDKKLAAQIFNSEIEKKEGRIVLLTKDKKIQEQTRSIEDEIKKVAELLRK
jgi:tetratricopeptide (TPR) repeat protein